MCCEYKFKATGCGHVTSCEPLRFIPCTTADESFPECIVEEPFVDKRMFKDHSRTCRVCVKELRAAPFNYGAELMAHASAAYKENPTDQVPVPEHIKKHLPLRGAAPAEETDYSGHPPPMTDLSPWHSPDASASSQKTGVVYTEEKKKYTEEVDETDNEVSARVRVVRGEAYMFWNDVYMDDSMREEMADLFREHEMVPKWTYGVQKKEEDWPGPSSPVGGGWS